MDVAGEAQINGVIFELYENITATLTSIVRGQVPGSGRQYYDGLRKY